MIREDKFVMSHRPYAVNLDSLRVHTEEPDPAKNWHNRVHKVAVDAVWFRRRSGVTVACVGTLWDIQRDPKPGDVHEALRRHDDGRYGGDCAGRWDGEKYWGAQQPYTAAEHLELLRPMLANYPAVPPGFDGWWTFRRLGKDTR